MVSFSSPLFFSVWFLKRRVGMFKWCALALVILGVAVVGLAGARERENAGDVVPRSSLVIYARGLSLDVVRISCSSQVSWNQALRTSIGVFVISIAQIFAGAQFVIEESIMSGCPIKPLELVGYEGVAALVVILSAQTVGNVTYGRIHNGSESVFLFVSVFTDHEANPIGINSGWLGTPNAGSASLSRQSSGP